jgi:hypothetical protein
VSALEKIYEMLQNGESFGEVLPHRLGGTFFWDVLSVSPVGKKYIRWRHYGSSANKNTKKDLAWILSEIFKMTPEEFMSKYTTYAEYKEREAV